MQELIFTENFNSKLFTDYFSDIRLHDDEIYFLGNCFKAYVKGTCYGIIEILCVDTYPFNRRGDTNRLLTDANCYLSCGNPSHYQAELLRKASGKTKLDDEDLLDKIVFSWKEKNFQTCFTLTI